jgi:hypothetical protein
MKDAAAKHGQKAEDARPRDQAAEELHAGDLGAMFRQVVNEQTRSSGNACAHDF